MITIGILTTIMTVNPTSHKNLQKFILENGINPSECGIIRITDTNKKFNSISHIPFKSTLELHFDDVEDGDGSPNIITKRHAESILGFIIYNWDLVKHLIICCDGGVSRSAAVAAAIRLRLGMDDWGIWRDGSKAPNMTVFRLLIDTFGIPLLDEEIARRETIHSMYFNKYHDLD